MKTITTLTAIAALIAGISIASAQNAGAPAGSSVSPSNINNGSPEGSQSGSERSGTAMKSGGMNKDARVVGNGKFCIEISKGGGINCQYTNLATCETAAQPNGLRCSPNPNLGTTGSK
jgi:hypothetical protein